MLTDRLQRGYEESTQTDVNCQFYLLLSLMLRFAISRFLSTIAECGISVIDIHRYSVLALHYNALLFLSARILSTWQLESGVVLLSAGIAANCK